MLQKTKLTNVDELKILIHKSLNDKISSDCALFDLPYYKNVGDVLIWQGELSFLKETNRNIVYQCSYNTCRYPKLDKDITILLQGGGNVGDLYPEHADFMLKIVESYNENPILFFPQTVYFKNKKAEQQFFLKLSHHNNITFCCRDRKSFETLKKYPELKSLSIPDMAFCIDRDYLMTFGKQNIGGNLYIKRTDKESNGNSTFTTIDKTSDWPAFEGKITKAITVNTIFDRLYKIFKSQLLNPKWDLYAFEYFRPAMIKMGVEFISPFENVYSERLHGAILAILLGKKVYIVDNCYGKNSAFYESWLKDFHNVNILD